MNDEMQKAIELQKRLHTGVKELIEDVYGEPCHFIIVMPDLQVMATTLGPEVSAIVLHNVVGSMMNNNYRATFKEEEDGTLNAVGMN